LIGCEVVNKMNYIKKRHHGNAEDFPTFWYERTAAERIASVTSRAGADSVVVYCSTPEYAFNKYLEKRNRQCTTPV
jgi:hypothetical protein